MEPVTQGHLQGAPLRVPDIAPSPHGEQTLNAGPPLGLCLPRCGCGVLRITPSAGIHWATPRHGRDPRSSGRVGARLDSTFAYAVLGRGAPEVWFQTRPHAGTQPPSAWPPIAVVSVRTGRAHTFLGAQPAEREHRSRPSHFPWGPPQLVTSPRAGAAPRCCPCLGRGRGVVITTVTVTVTVLLGVQGGLGTSQGLAHLLPLKGSPDFLVCRQGDRRGWGQGLGSGLGSVPGTQGPPLPAGLGSCPGFVPYGDPRPPQMRE